MGCSQSKIENEEAVARCKERKRFMKEAVSTRNAFAAAHSAYATCLKNTGAALGDFAHGEVQNPQLPRPSSSGAADSPFPIPPQQPFEIPLPPPPLPDAFSPSPLQRAASMPEMIINKPDRPKPMPKPIIEEDDDDLLEMENEDEGSLRKRKTNRNNSSSRRDANNIHSEEPPPPPSKHPQPLSHNNDDVTHHQSISQPPHDSAWEYFFPSMENIAGTTLHDAEQIDPKVFDEKPKRALEDEVHSSRVPVPDPDPQPQPQPEPQSEPQPPPVNVPEEMMESPAPPIGKGKQTAAVAGSADGKRILKYSTNLLQIFAELDDHFLKASESAHEVTKMLEATRLHYHSNFADNRGHIDHSARVMRVITWNRSFKGIPNLDDGKDDFDSDENETHATILDKLLAWEKKLYDEVKAGELMKFEYQRKVATLNKLKKRGTTNSEALEKAKAVVSHLHTRYIVDMQSLDSTVSEINRLRDEQLYPRLVQLVDGMATMWRVMHDHHEKQSEIVKKLKILDISQSSKQTSEHHHDRTYQLLVVAQQWHSQFELLVNHQKGYIKALNTWLKLNLTPIESSLREKVSSPPRVRNPPIQGLLYAWNDRLEKLPDELARTAIGNFVGVVDTIFNQQQEELALKRKCEDTRKELARKTKQFEEWRNKYLQRKTPDEFNPDRAEDASAPDEVVTERQFVVEQVNKRLEEEEEAYVRQCLQVRQKALGSLKNRMPELFRAMSDFSLECSKMYSELKTISQNLGESLA